MVPGAQGIVGVAIVAVPILVAVVFHEVAHGAVAYAFGDPTAARAGRLTLNPIPHIDPFGTVILPGLLYLFSHGAFLFVDDAHAIGVLGAHGRGTVEHFGLAPELIDIRVGTLSKALPAVGGFALTQRDVAVLLRYTSHGALYSAAMTPPDVAVAMAAMEILGSDADLVERLRRNASFFRDALQRRGLDILGSQTAIVPIRIGDSRATLDVAAALLKRGIFVNPVIYPAVPKGAERLRCFVMASHSTADLEYAAAGIEETVNADAALHSARPSRP